MGNIKIYVTLENVTGEPIVNASQVGSGTMRQDTINSNLMEGKIYDAEKGEWVSNTSELTEATTADAKSRTS